MAVQADQEASSGKLRRDSRRLFVLVWILWILILLLIASSMLHDSIQSYISDPVLFRVRHTLQKTPPLSPRLKVFALDDGTMSFLRQPELTTEDLTLLLENIARQKPKAILLDRLFTNAPQEDRGTEFLERLRAIKDAPIYSGAWVNGQAISYRVPLQLHPDRYGVRHWVKGDPVRAQEFVHRHLHAGAGYIYAYDEAFEGSFAGVGHLRFDRVGSVYPLISYQDAFLLPHIALYAADTIEIEDHLTINGIDVPLNGEGAVSVNHRPVNMFYENMKSLRFAISRARAGQAETWIQEGDVVVILFNFFTGSTDFLEGAPFGDLPGGLLVSTLVDSILENRWLRQIDCLPYFILSLSVLGTLIARHTGPIQFWGVIILVGGGVFVLTNYLFSYHSIVLPWVLPLTGLLGNGLIQYIYNRLGSEWRTIELQNQYLIERARRLEEEKTKVQLAERLNLGRAVQEILLPSQDEQTFGRFRFAMSYIPAQEMSGDWLYLWGQGHRERRILLGDVVGKGPSAAIPVAILIGILGECERLNMSMHETLLRLNQRIIELFQQQITCSCTAVVLKEGGSIELFNAGSPGWFLKDGPHSRHIPLRSTALGMSMEASFAHQALELSEAAMLFTFTDGYMEGARAFKRLIQRVDQLSELPTFRDLATLLDEVGQGFRLEDDRSLLLLHVRPETSV